MKNEKNETPQIEFYVSMAGIAGDEHRLMVGVLGDRRETTMFDRSIFKDWNMRRARKRLIKRFKTLAPESL